MGQDHVDAQIQKDPTPTDAAGCDVSSDIFGILRGRWRSSLAAIHVLGLLIARWGLNRCGIGSKPDTATGQAYVALDV